VPTLIAGYHGRCLAGAYSISTFFLLRAAGGGGAWAIFLLPLSGLFMSVFYPPLPAEVGTRRWFRRGSAFRLSLVVPAPSPEAGSAIQWAARDMASFWQQDLPFVLFIGLTLNWIYNPTLRVFRQVNETEYTFCQTGVTNDRP
jgi:hypothetical protein